jgi:hypothetical protein
MATHPDLAILPGSGPGAAACTWRGLGQAGDLDLDFRAADRPGLVSAVLSACAAPPLDDPETVWRLSCAARIGGLLAVHAATDGVAAVDLHFACPACDMGLEAALPVAALMKLARAAEAAPETDLALPGGHVRLRRPTGADQRAWRRAAPADPAAARAAILGRLVVAGHLAEADIPAAEEALAAFDPLPAFALDATCPDCGTRADIAADLEAILLDLLARAQDRMLTEIDALARRFGWTEAEILAVPAWRRRRYLALSEEAAEWP